MSGRFIGISDGGGGASAPHRPTEHYARHPGLEELRHPGLDPGSRCLCPWLKKAGSRVKPGMTECWDAQVDNLECRGGKSHSPSRHQHRIHRLRQHVRIIQIIMQPPTFLALQCTANYQPRDFQQIA